MTDLAMTVSDTSSRHSRWNADLRELLGAGFLRNVIESLGSRGVLLVLSVITAVIVTRALGPQGRGLYATAVALSAIGIQVGNMGLHASNTWAVARDKSLLGALIANSLVASAVIGGAIVALSVLALALMPDLAPMDISLLALSLVSIPVGLAYLLLHDLLLGIGRIRAYNALEVGMRVAATAVLVGLVVSGLIAPWSAFSVVVLLTGIAGLIAFGLLSRSARASLRPSRLLIMENARYGLKAYFSAMVAFLLLRVDVLIVQAMLGAEQTGFYSVAASLAENIYVVPMVIGGLLFARLSAMSNVDAQWRIARSAVVGIGLVMAIAVLVAAPLAAPIVELLFGVAFMPSVAPLIWLLPGIFFVSLNTPS